MDILLAEISNKKKDLVTPAGSGSKQKYMRKADIERAREEEARKKKEEEEQKKREEKLAREKEKVIMIARLRPKSQTDWLAVNTRMIDLRPFVTGRPTLPNPQPLKLRRQRLSTYLLQNVSDDYERKVNRSCSSVKPRRSGGYV
jgi:hypothetical protein